VSLAEFFAILRKREPFITEYEYTVKLRASTHLDWETVLHEQLHIASDKVDVLSVAKNGSFEAAPLEPPRPQRRHLSPILR
jgi:hypothetical protein